VRKSWYQYIFPELRTEATLCNQDLPARNHHSLLRRPTVPILQRWQFLGARSANKRAFPKKRPRGRTVLRKALLEVRATQIKYRQARTSLLLIHLI